MTTWDMIIALFYHVDEQLHDMPKHPEAHLWPSELGRVDELFDANPRGHQMNEGEKGLAQFLIPRGNASKLFEFVKEPFHLLP